MPALSLRTRLTLWYSFALLVALCALAADIVWQEGRLGRRRVDRELDALNATMAHVVRDGLGADSDIVRVAGQVRDAITTPGLAVVILDGDGRALAARWGGLELPDPQVLAQPGPLVRSFDTGSGLWRVRAERQQFDDQTLVLVVGASLGDVQREQHEVVEAMLVGIPLILLLAGGGGFWLASVGLRPITEMARRATRIAPAGMEDLGQADRADELGQLAGAFNGLVSRLRAALRTQRQLMADASHELRTPVSVVRTAAEVTLSQAHREESEYREALAIVDGQAQRLSRLVEDMLVLARADAGGYPLRSVDLYLDEIVDECCRTVGVLATSRGVSVRSASSPDLAFRGDEDLLRRCLLNLLQNAVQHTPSGGVVTIEAAPREARIEIRVRDTGPGIPAEDQERVFDRFVQLDSARRAQGTGLGLPIARWIAEVHGGSLTLEASGATGSTFCLSLPGRQVTSTG